MNAGKRFRGVLVASVLTFAAALHAFAVADRASITGLRPEIADDQILLSFRLVGAFDEDLQKRIHSGLPTDLSYRFRLTRHRRRWFDKDLGAGTMQVVAMYNAVTREYLINYKRDGDLVESRVVRDEKELRAAMTELERMPAFAIAEIPASALERRMEVKVRAELGTRMLLWLIPTTITTDWARAQLQLASPGA